MNSRKIFLVIPSLECGGAEGIMIQIAEALRDAGWHPIVFTFVPGNVHGTTIEHRVLPKAHPGLFRPYRNFLRRTIAFARAVKKEKPITILGYVPWANVLAVLGAMLTGRLSRTRVIISDRSLPSYTYNQIPKHRSIIWQTLVRLLYPFANLLVFDSLGSEREFRKWFGKPTRILIMHNPLPIEKIKQQSRQQPHHPWARSSIPFFLSIGRLDPYKDHHTLLHAFARIRKHRKTRLFIAGTGPERNRLEETARSLGIEQDIAFLGYEPNPHSYLRKCTALIHTSRSDSFPNVLLEALTLGKPVIATACTGPQEILQDKYGILVPIGNAQAVAEAAVKILKSPSYTKELGRLGRERASNFDSRKMLPKYIALLTRS